MKAQAISIKTGLTVDKYTGSALAVAWWTEKVKSKYSNKKVRFIYE